MQTCHLKHASARCHALQEPTGEVGKDQSLSGNAVSTVAITRSDGRIALDTDTKQFFVQCLFLLATLRMLAGHAIDRAVMFDEYERAIVHLLILTHVTLFCQDVRQFSDLFFARFAFQARRKLFCQRLAPGTKDIRDSFIATFVGDVIQYVKRKLRIVLRKLLFSFGGECVEVAWTPNAPPYPGHFDKPIPLKQSKVLPDTHRTDLQLLA